MASIIVMIKGLVLYGINNIYTVECDGETYECRIKGKVLKEDDKVYNPLAPGDWVEIELVEGHAGQGMIKSRLKRENGFIRWNKKRRAPQIIAANVDLMACVVSVRNPPFVSGFLDRALITAKIDGIKPIIIFNKIDKKIKDDVQVKIDNYKNLGYRVFLTSAKTGEGVEEVQKYISGKLTAFAGQSGVGKSTILNQISPGLKLRTGDISSKYNRGRHTTCFSMIAQNDETLKIMDTPGVRDLEVYGISSDELHLYFPEFEGGIGECSFNRCSHVHEPGCKIREALEEGIICEDRYASYCQMYKEIEERERDVY